MITSAALAVFLAWYSAFCRCISRSICPRYFKAFRYCIPLGLSGLAVLVIHYGDRAFLRRSVSLSELGVYALAYKFGMMLAFVHAPFQSHWTARLQTSSRTRTAETVYVRTTTLLVAVLTFFSLALAFFSKPLTHVMAGPAFAGASALIPWIGLAYLIRALAAHLQCVFIIEGKPGLELRVNGIGSAACLVAYATLIPRYHLWGAVAATLIGFGVILGYGFWEAAIRN